MFEVAKNKLSDGSETFDVVAVATPGVVYAADSEAQAQRVCSGFNAVVDAEERNLPMSKRHGLSEVISIGTEDSKDCVVRIRHADGRMRNVSTNLVSFAQLAADGVRVFNR